MAPGLPFTETQHWNPCLDPAFISGIDGRYMDRILAPRTALGQWLSRIKTRPHQAIDPGVPFRGSGYGWGRTVL